MRVDIHIQGSRRKVLSRIAESVSPLDLSSLIQLLDTAFIESNFIKLDFEIGYGRVVLIVNPIEIELDVESEIIR